MVMVEVVVVRTLAIISQKGGILVADGLALATARDLDIYLSVIRRASQRRARWLVEREIATTIQKIIRQLTLSGIEGDARAAELQERIVTSSRILGREGLNAGPDRA
jgi:hypothetical protein